MTDEPDLQGMVLAFAASSARKCVEAVVAAGLDGGRLEDKLDAGNVEWHIVVTYNRPEGFVRVTGHPHREEAAMPTLAMMFGWRDEDAFDFVLPASWLPQAVTVVGQGAPEGGWLDHA